MTDEIGVIYVGTNTGFVKEAIESAKTLKSNMDVEITLFTNKERDLDIFDDVVVIPDPKYNFYDKLYGMRNSPYCKTVYLDTDIYVDSSFDDLYDLLNRFDIAAAHDVKRWGGGVTENSTEPGRYVDGVPRGFPMYNTGVVVFDSNNRTKELFQNWDGEYRDTDNPDQPSFRRALYNSDVHVTTLPHSYNYVAHRPGYAYGEVKIIHHRLVDIDTLGAEKTLDVKEFASKINEDLGQRVSYGTNEGIECTHHVSKPFYNKVSRSIHKNGFTSTIYKGIQTISKKFK